MIRQILLVVGLTGMLILAGASLAQDATPTAPLEGEMPAEGVAPIEGDIVEEPNLESVTADPIAHYGQEVTLEGVLAEFVNVRTFVLSEGAVLDDDKVLVINNTPIELDPSLVTGGRVRITGVVMPSYNEGGFDQVINNFMNIISAAPAPAEPEPAMEATPADTTAEEATPADGAGVVEETPAEGAVEATPAEDAAEATPAEGAVDEASDTEPTPDSAAAVDATPAEGGEPVEATPAEVEPVAPDTSAETPGMSFDNIDFTPLTNAIAERFPDFTILEITSIEDVTFIPPTE